jgi:hypothetical protein
LNLGHDVSGTTSAQRRSDRLFCPMRIRVSGEDSFGRPFQEETLTVSINQHGGCITLAYQVSPGSQVRLHNLQNGRESAFRVVSETRRVFGDRAEWGVEVLEPEADFWGVQFVPPPGGPIPKVLIRCKECQGALLSPLHSAEHEILLYTGFISRHCAPCDATTRWQPAPDPILDELAARLRAEAESGSERRVNPRRRLLMRLQVRDSTGGTTEVQTLDVSKGGLSFLTRQPHQTGETLIFVLPGPTIQNPVETRGKLVWGRETELGRVYGARYVKETVRSTS